MNRKNIIISTSLLVVISLVAHILYHVLGIQTPDYFIDFCIVAIVGFSTFHHYKRGQFDFRKRIFQGHLIGVFSGIISGIIIVLSPFTNFDGDCTSFFELRLIIFLTWVVEAGLTALFVSFILKRLTKNPD